MCAEKTESVCDEWPDRMRESTCGHPSTFARLGCHHHHLPHLSHKHNQCLSLTMNNPPTMEYMTQQLARLLVSSHIVSMKKKRARKVGTRKWKENYCGGTVTGSFSMIDCDHLPSLACRGCETRSACSVGTRASVVLWLSCEVTCRCATAL